MKQLLPYFRPLLIASIIMLVHPAFGPGSEPDFEKLWKLAEKHRWDGLPKSALDVVEQIRLKAMETNNQPELLRTIIYRISLTQETEEDHLESSIKFVLGQLGLMKQPERQILHSVVAELYWFYYQQNRHELLDRTTLASNTSDDIAEWDVPKLRKTILDHYALSLENKDILRSIPVSDYSGIILLEKDSKQLQPFLYDFLAHRALDFYTAEEAGFTAPGRSPDFFHPTTGKNILFAPVRDFVRNILPPGEYTGSRALRLFQELQFFHLTTGLPETLTRNELKRLKLALQLSSGLPNHEQEYLNALENLQSDIAQWPVSALVAHERAVFLMGRRQQPVPFDDLDEKRFSLSQAREIALAAIAAYPDSEGAQHCRLVVEQVEQKELGLQLQRVELPGTPVPVRLSYRNIRQPSFRLLSIGSERLAGIVQKGDPQHQLKELLRIKPIKSWSLELPFEDDFREHSAIIDLPPLPAGLYVLMVSGGPSFNDKSIVEYTSFQISRLSFISNRADDRHNFYLLDRETGKAVGNADIRVMKREWDRRERNYTVEEILRLKTAKNGSFSVGFDQVPDNKFFYVEAVFKGDSLFSDRFFDTYKRRKDQKTALRTWFFTDRAIYRPGQTVYFKGIMIETSGKKNELAKSRESKVRLFDANHQEIGSLQVKTNEFGSFEGSYVLPLGGLTGQFRLADDHGSANFSVEEYKRPTFEVSLIQPSGQVKLGSQVEIAGSVSAFAGYPISNAGFSYRIMRETRFPYWRSWIPPVSGPAVLVASGEGKTGEDGRLNLSFTAWPDTDVHRTDPVFYYEVLVDVTDKNGETRSASLSVVVGSKALLLSADIPDLVNIDSVGNFRLYSKNLQQQAVEVPVTVKISRLSPLTTLLREPVLAPVDRMLLDSSRLASLFPMDDFYNWFVPEKRKRELVSMTKLVTASGSAPLFAAESKGWSQGTYLLEMEATDEFGQSVRFERLFTLFATKSKVTPELLPAWFYVDKKEALPGQHIEFQIGTAAKDVRALVEVFANDRIVESGWHTLGSSRKSLRFDLTEEHRGMIRVQMSFVRFNRMFRYSENIRVPYTNKMLDISLETKRDKLLPGAAETWKLRVQDKNGRPVLAEMLASMYDASLDQFKPHAWDFNLLHYPVSVQSWSSDNGFATFSSQRLAGFFGLKHEPPHNIMPPQLNWFGFQRYGFNLHSGRGIPLTMSKSTGSTNGEALIASNDSETVVEGSPLFMLDDDARIESKEQAKPQGPKTMVRRNFSETAFFYPQLTTDSLGGLSVSFTLPDALTRWKLMLLAHTADLKTGMAEHSFAASRPFMIVPNTPRFYREGDTAWVSARVVNTGDAEVTGIAGLELRDAPTGALLSYNTDKQKPILKLAAGKSQEVSWKLIIGESSSLLSMLFTVSANEFSDAEQQYVPVLSRTVLVTETLPLRVGAGAKTEVQFKSLLESKDVRSHQLVVDFTSNPAWYAVQALPYLAAPSHENADNLFNRYYANRLAAHIANSIPRLMDVVNTWKTIQPDALLSNLEKNQELKSILLAETPWLMEGKDESMQKRNISLLFDLNRMRYEEEQSLSQLTALQLSSGGWPWFRGMPEDRFVTQQIVAGLGRLKHLGLLRNNDQALRSSIARAIRYLDAEIQHDYDNLNKWNTAGSYVISPLHLYYLYARSFFADIPLSASYTEAYGFFLGKLQNDWLKLNPGLQAMAALTLNRKGETAATDAIMKSLFERSINHPELGRYWKQNKGYFWHETPVESQALLIEAFEALTKDRNTVDEMRTWLLAQKQTHRWPGSRATAEAVYALLLRGTDWIASSKPVNISVGGVALDNAQAEAGTGYISHRWDGTEVTPGLANISMHNPNQHPAWGGAYWQYFAPLDRLNAHSTSLRLRKEVYLEKPGQSEMVLVPAGGQRIETGSRVRVRLIIETDRDIEYVHLKDYRAAAFEPLNVLSGYKVQGGLAYYESTRDASTDFFIPYLVRGKYVFEYSLMATQKGNFANGHATIQCLYAPEFAARSEGGRVVVGF
jgi:hypothetical protein